MKNLNNTTQTPKAPVASNKLQNTTWKTDSGSEVRFSKIRINWYEYATNPSKKCLSGVYKLYIGQEAVNYITHELSEYKITKSDLYSIFHKNNDCSINDFVVIAIRYDKYIQNGKGQRLIQLSVPWFGYIVDKESSLNIINMINWADYTFFKNTDR